LQILEITSGLIENAKNMPRARQVGLSPATGEAYSMILGIRMKTKNLDIFS
jgi:hypothetical protein